MYPLLIVSLVFTSVLFAQKIPSPKEHFGFNIGDDYKLANYTQTAAYFKKVAAVSDRVKLVDIGKTEEGRSQYMLIVSSPENLKRLDYFKNISQQLAHAENLSDKDALALAEKGKTIVWIDGGLHATEVVGAHQLIETLYQVISRTDKETLRILKETIILFTHANPDGQELVSDWYMSNPDVKKRNTLIPRLYEKYIGHDNNRDFFMMNMKETQNMSRQQYIEWLPQIIYNHHQTGPAGSVLAGPPYRDPFNYVFDPLLVTSLDEIGAAMNNRLNRENKPGYTQRAGSVYSTWWNGGLRTTAYFHNMIGLLTEIIGSPTPTEVPLVPGRLIPNAATPNPVTPQTWHFSRSIDYSISLNYAVLNYAVNNRENILYGMYRMGKNAIDQGSRDHWSLSPKHIDSIVSAYKKDPKNARPGQAASAARFNPMDSIPSKYFDVVYKDLSLRDARGYIIPADQPDFLTAVKFINALIRSGIQVQKASADFSVVGKKYPAGSYIIKTAQAFRPHVLDMFEPQDHPNDFLYPGGPPVRPYDAAGWTLAYEMGIRFDRLLGDFTGPFQQIPYGEIQLPVGKVENTTAGYLLDARVNDAFIAVNTLLKSGAEVYRIPASANGAFKGGAFYIPSATNVKAIADKAALEYGLHFTEAANKPEGNMKKISAMRIGLWDAYGGSIPSGWVRWLMDQYGFNADVIFASDINAGNLNAKYDLIIFVPGAIPALGRSAETDREGGGRTPKPEEVPAEYRNRLVRMSADTSIPQIKKFLENGGSVITIGNSTNLAYHLKLPVRNALVEIIDGEERVLPGEKFYIPGSILKVSLDSTQTATSGMGSGADIYFNASPVFKLSPEAIAKGQIKPLVWFASNKPLRSGWAWGQAYLQDGVVSFMASVGRGTFYAFSPEITFRGQTHGNFKLLFNQLYKLGD